MIEETKKRTCSCVLSAMYLEERQSRLVQLANSKDNTTENTICWGFMDLHKVAMTIVTMLILSMVSGCDLERSLGELEEGVPFEFELLAGVQLSWSTQLEAGEAYIVSLSSEDSASKAGATMWVSGKEDLNSTLQKGKTIRDGIRIHFTSPSDGKVRIFVIGKVEDTTSIIEVVKAN
jgi:hypothetical protein